MRPILPLSLAALGALAACLTPAPKVPSGAEDFATFCAACHGPGGKGDGPAAADLARKPADLTRLSLADGSFPATRVMAKIWGYTGGKGGAQVMPAYGALLDGESIPYDGGDGIQTPTPIRLVQLSEHLKGLQAR